MKSSGGVRKGAWSGEEDVLLRRCIELHGQGQWHLVPQRAGLNRCRKSCRLRWLNYLQPNLKKEEFKEDEIDLIFKMHKLLGNKWSLIAGRIPGRTANDIKNYWNSHLKKRIGSKLNASSGEPKLKKNEVIRPQPRLFKYRGPVAVNMQKRKCQQETEEQGRQCMLRHIEEKNMWGTELLHECGQASVQSTACESETVKFHATDSGTVKFDDCGFEWESLLGSNDW